MLRQWGPGRLLLVEPRVGRVSGLRHGKEMLLLVADYFRRSEGALDVHLSAPAPSQIRDLLTGQIVTERVPSGKSTVRIDLGDAPARLLHLSPLD